MLFGGQAAARAAVKLKNNGFYPDVIIAHAGFGADCILKMFFRPHVESDFSNGITPVK